MKKVLIFFFVLAILFVPVAGVYGQTDSTFVGPIVKCGTEYDSTGKITNPCGICDLVGLANNIISFAIYLAVIVAAIMFIVAGMKYLTAGGDPSKISSAHKIFWNVIVGLVLVLTAWLIIELILTTFTEKGFGFWSSIEGC